MTKIEQELEKRIFECWVSSLEGVIAVADGAYKPYCCCDPMRNNPRIGEFLVDGKTYTPAHLLDAITRKESVYGSLKQKTLDRICNLFAALGEAVKSERPLYTKDRRPLFGDDPRFNFSYQGEIRDALIGYANYLVASSEDDLLLVETDDWENCANKAYAESLKDSIQMHTDFAKENPERFGLDRFKANLRSNIDDHKKQLQCILDDDIRVAMSEVRGGTRYVGFLVYQGVEPAVSDLIGFHTSKTLGSAHSHNH